MNELPLVSISCLTFNHAPYLENCLNSFLQQKTNFSFEILIHDDASTDDTIAIINKFAAQYPDQIFPFIQPNNQYVEGVRGIMERFNFPRARGKYIALCEGDDFWTDPQKLQSQVDFLEANQDYSLVLNNVENLYEYNPEEHGYDFWKHQINADIDFDVDTENLIRNPMGALTSGSMFRMSCFKSNEKLKRAIGGEVKFWLLLSKYGKIRFRHQAMSKYRRQQNSISHSPQFTQQKLGLLLNRIDYFNDLNAYFDFKYQEAFEEKVKFLIFDFIQKRKGINQSIIGTIKDLIALSWKKPECLKVFKQWLQFKLGIKKQLFGAETQLLVDEKRGVFILRNKYGVGKFTIKLVGGEQTIEMGEYTFYNKQPLYIGIPESITGKDYTFQIFMDENQGSPIDSINFTLQ